MATVEINLFRSAKLVERMTSRYNQDNDVAYPLILHSALARKSGKRRQMLPRNGYRPWYCSGNGHTFSGTSDRFRKHSEECRHTHYDMEMCNYKYVSCK